MKQFNLPPSSPLIQSMTLEQRNFCIANMNEDVSESNGKNNHSVSDTSDDSWFTDWNRSFLPKGFDEKKYIKKFQKFLGPETVRHDQQMFRNFRASAKRKHAYRNGQVTHVMNHAMNDLHKKVKAKRNRDNQNGFGSKGQYHGFKV